MDAHFVLFVADQAAATAFYSAVLARQPRLDVPGMTEIALAAGAILGLMPEAGIRRLLPDLPELPGPGAVRAAPRGELYLLVADPEGHLTRLAAAGGRLLDPVRPRDWGHRAGYGLDLDGHLVVFAAPI